MRNLAILVGVIAGIFGLSEAFCADKVNSADLVKQYCTQCHNLDKIKARTKTKTGWEKTVERMVKKLTEKDKNVNVSQDNTKQLVEILYQEYGYKDAKTEAEKFAERRKKTREIFPVSEPNTVSPNAKTVK